MRELLFVRCEGDDYGPLMAGWIIREATEGDEGEAAICEKPRWEECLTTRVVTAREAELIHSRYMELQCDLTKIHLEHTEDDSVVDEACNRNVFAGIQVRTVGEQVAA